jgi:hypothetical protein
MVIQMKTATRIASILILTIISFEIGMGLCSYTDQITPDTTIQAEPQFTPISAQTDNYGFRKFGLYIEGPTYIQRRVNQTINNLVLYRPIDNILNEIPNRYDYYYIKFGNETSNKIMINGETFSINVYPYIALEGVFNLSLLVHHQSTDTNISKNIILNVTTGINFARDYPEMTLIQFEAKQFSMRVSPTNQGTYSYTLIVNNIQKLSGTKPTNEDFYWSSSEMGIQNIIGNHTVKYIVTDISDNSIAINEFIISVVSQNFPHIDYINFDCQDQFKIGITQNRIMRFTVNHDLNNLDAAYIINTNNSRILHKFINITTGQQLSFELNALMLLGGNLTYAINSGFDLRLIVVDRNGKKSDSPGLNLNIYLPNSFLTIRSDAINISSALNAIGVSFSEYDGNQLITDLSYKVSAAAKSNITQRFLLMAGTAQRMRNYDYLPSNQGMDILYQQQYKSTNYNSYFFAGVVFSVIVEDKDQVNWPVKVKIEYPSWLEPDARFEEPSLKCFRLNSNCGGNTYYEKISEDNVSISSVNTVIINIYQPGYYVFGKSNAEYSNLRGNSVDGFPIFGILGMMGIAFAILVNKTQKHK